MAVAAETQTKYQLVDELPGVYEARQAERFEAEFILDQRRHDQAAGVDYLLPVDVLGTARKLLAYELAEGDQSSQLRDELAFDCQRYVAEWYSRLSPEYFAPIRHAYDETSQDFYSRGLSLRQMTENALIPMPQNTEEEDRRINERVEDATLPILKRFGHCALDAAVVTISECSDAAIEHYEYDQQQDPKTYSGYFGYVPEIQKMTIRRMWLNPETNDRYQEQAMLPGTYITHEIVQMALEDMGIESAKNMDKTALHGAQILATDSLTVILSRLDKVASEQWCVPIFMGEVVDKDHHRDYDRFQQEAVRRQDGLHAIAQKSAAFILELTNDDCDAAQAQAKVEWFVGNELTELCKLDISLASRIFDADSAKKISKIVSLQQKGDYDRAARLQTEFVNTAPTGGCGAGSCGLELVSASEIKDLDLVKKLKLEPGDTVLKDTERACKCGAKEIIYGFNKSKVNKLCKACGATSFEKKTAEPRILVSV